MILYGPATVTVDGTSLGDTYGGVSVTLEKINTNEIGNDREVLTGATGQLNLYQLSSAVTLSQSDIKLWEGELVFSGDNYTLTFYSAKLFFGDSFSTGTFNQQAVPVSFIARANGSGNVLKLED